MTKKHNVSSPLDVIDLIGRHADGAVLDALNHDLAAVARAVQRTGNAGKIVLTIEVKSGGDRLVEVALVATAKVPRQRHGARDLYVHEDGGLREHHPEQKMIAFDVDAAAQRGGGAVDATGGDL